MPNQPGSPVIRIATRGSALALAQANTVLDLCRQQFPRQTFELTIIKTTGDKLQTASLASPALPKGLFTKELETALLTGKADLAVHSLKDLPTDLPEGLTLGAVLERADVRDVVVHKDIASTARSLAELPTGATIATSSTRREAQLRHQRADLKIVPIRGNVPTRLKKLSEQKELDGTILAAAGLARLKMSIGEDNRLTSAGPEIPTGLAAFPVPLYEMLPCVGQAAIGIEVRKSDPAIEAICQHLTHAPTFACVTAERAFLKAMGGGCQLAVAAHAVLQGQTIRLTGVSFLGRKPVSAEHSSAATDPTSIGQALASELSQ